ncbi:type II toxin-antitoxin system RelB/DinJ family antitoxin [Enterobacteriaceae bacterium ESL0689]|nr:type II toxin-antitoxin system RelB/DinJ family antitoxin [Enterobacteriaceae bacterium ESL0689]
MNADALVKARIPKDTKERAVAALNKIGLSTSDVIRLVMIRIADEGRLPFEINTPNAITRKAIEELETGHGKRFESTEAMFNDLEI